MPTQHEVSKYLAETFDYAISAIAKQKATLNAFEDGSYDFEYGNVAIDSDETVAVSITITGAEHLGSIETRHNHFEDFMKELERAVIDAGLPDNADAILEMLRDFSAKVDRPNLAIIRVESGIVDAVASTQPLQIFILDKDVEGTDYEDILTLSDGTEIYNRHSEDVEVAEDYVRNLFKDVQESRARQERA